MAGDELKIGKTDIYLYAVWNIKRFTVTWIDGDGKTLGVEGYDYFEIPVYKGATPTKTATAQYTYTFNGTWAPVIAIVTEDAEYVAQFDATINKYTVTWIDWDGATLDEEVYKYGDMPIFKRSEPTRASTAQYEYTFSGWDPTLETVTGNATYTAQYNEALRKYLVTFDPGDIKMADFAKVSSLVEYGAIPTAPHPYAKFSYKFLGWRSSIDGILYAPSSYMNPADVKLPEVTCDVTYTAEWTFVNDSVVFPDKIPPEAHFDKWWGDYGIICFAASTTKDDVYTILFADWFFNVYKSCVIGYGSPGKTDYEIVFEEDGTTMWQITGNGAKKQITNKGDIKYAYNMTCIRDGMYFTKDKNHNYGLDFGNQSGVLQGVSFINPFFM